MNYIKSNVITVGIGMCASMAAIILSSGYKRYALKNTDIMIHQPLGGTTGQATDIKIEADRINIIKKKLNKILADNTKQTIKKISKDTDRNKYFSALEAKKYGLIDIILDKVPY